MKIGDYLIAIKDINIPTYIITHTPNGVVESDVGSGIKLKCGNRVPIVNMTETLIEVKVNDDNVVAFSYNNAKFHEDYQVYFKETEKYNRLNKLKKIKRKQKIENLKNIFNNS